MYIFMYIYGMVKRYSIAEARRHLPSVIDQAQAGTSIELTRRGQPVAVVVSADEYARITGHRTSFAQMYAKFRQEFPQGRGGVPRRVLLSLRDRSPGRKVRL